MTTEHTNAFQIARMADVAAPDALDSPGAEWLELVYRDAVELLEEHDDYDDARDEIGERADQIVPIYTHLRWQVFIDLAAYTEDVDEFGPYEDLTQAAGVALYMIAERVYFAVIEEAEEGGEEE